MTNSYDTATDTDVPQMLSLETVSERLDVSRDTVYRLCRAGDLTPTRVGRQLRFFPDDVNRYLNAGRDLPMNFADLIGERI